MRRLDASAPGFTAEFDALVNDRRESDSDVSTDVAAIIARVKADGVHLPERMSARAPMIRRPGWVVTAAAHSLKAARIALAAGADAAVVSAIFPSNSPSAGKPVGALKLAALTRAAGGPVYGLGGINDKTARRLLQAGLVGLAAGMLRKLQSGYLYDYAFAMILGLVALLALANHYWL